MTLVLIVLALLIIFGGGGYYGGSVGYWAPNHGMSGGLGLAIIVLLILYLTGNL